MPVATAERAPGHAPELVLHAVHEAHNSRCTPNVSSGNATPATSPSHGARVHHDREEVCDRDPEGCGRDVGTVPLCDLPGLRGGDPLTRARDDRADAADHATRGTRKTANQAAAAARGAAKKPAELRDAERAAAGVAAYKAVVAE